jgi:branched-chain amino acid aminotransferase
MNSQLANLEAGEHGYDEAIMLDVEGHVAEGSGENLFIVEDGKLITPGLGNSILSGITRDSVMKIAADLGYEVKEDNISRERLYLADEVFFTGTAAEITPIRAVDNRKIGEGRRGPVAKELQETFFNIVEGKVEDKFGWLTYVD